MATRCPVAITTVNSASSSRSSEHSFASSPSGSLRRGPEEREREAGPELLEHDLERQPDPQVLLGAADDLAHEHQPALLDQLDRRHYVGDAVDVERVEGLDRD